MDTLPLEMLAQIFQRLNGEDLQMCRLTSEKWKCLIDSPFVKFRTSLSNESVEDILESQLTKLTARVYNFDVKYKELYKSKSRNPFVSKFEAIDFITWYDPDLNYSQLQKNAFRLIELNQTITTLEFGSAFWETKAKTFAPWLSLEKLNFLKISTRFAHKTLGFFAKVTAPSLQRICIRDVSYCKDYKNYLAIYKLMSMFSSTLKKVDVFHYDAEDMYDGRLSVKGPSSVDALVDQLKQLQPSSLNMAFHPRENVDYTLGSLLCRSIVSLVVLQVSLPHSHQLEMPLANLIQQNQYTLRQVRIDSNNPQQYNSILLNISFCVCLEILEFDNIEIPSVSVRFPPFVQEVRLMGFFEEDPAWLFVLANEKSLQQLFFANYAVRSSSMYNKIIMAKELNPETSYYIHEDCIVCLNDLSAPQNRTFYMQVGNHFRTRREKFIRI